MTDFERFIVENADAETSRLILSCKSWPEPPVSFPEGTEARDIAVNTIEARKKLKKKVPEWHSCTSLVYPSTLCAEQCSSSQTAKYKASLAERILAGNPNSIIEDLTGGLGIDSWAFSKVVANVVYNDANKSLAAAARHNFTELGTRNISIRSEQIEPGKGLVQKADLIFLDPARRADDGRKVFLIEDCQPDILKLLPELMAASPNILVKLSPMADISMVVERLNKAYERHLEENRIEAWNHKWVREVHVLSTGGECKELLVWMDRNWNGPHRTICMEDGNILEFSAEELMEAKAVLPSSTYGNILFEPGKSLTKAGASNALCHRFGLVKLARFTHLYTIDSPLTEQELKDRATELKEYGKVFRIKEILPFNRASIKDLARKYPHSEVTARNMPLSSDELRRKMGVSSGDDAHIFGARIELPFESGNFLIAALPF